MKKKLNFNSLYLSIYKKSEFLNLEKIIEFLIVSPSRWIVVSSGKRNNHGRFLRFLPCYSSWIRSIQLTRSLRWLKILERGRKKTRTRDPGRQCDGGSPRNPSRERKQTFCHSLNLRRRKYSTRLFFCFFLSAQIQEMSANSHPHNSQNVLCNAAAGAAAGDSPICLFRSEIAYLVSRYLIIEIFVGVFAATFVCPLDVIKTRFQVHGLPKLGDANIKGFVLCFFYLVSSQNCSNL